MPATITWDNDLQFYAVKIQDIWMSSARKRKESTEFEKILFLIRAIPASARIFDPKSKLWYVKEQYIDLLTMSFTHAGIKFFIVKKDDSLFTPSVTKTNPVEDFFTALPQDVKDRIRSDSHLSQDNNDLVLYLQKLSIEDVKKYYHQAAFILHPDRGGATEQFTKMQKAWDEMLKKA